jgi:type IV pilus assembly protein PilC
MAVYEYTAIDENGSEYTSTYEDIKSIVLLRVELAKMGEKLIKAKLKKTGSKKSARIKQIEVVTFAHQFAGMCSAGLSIIKSLETLEKQCANEGFKVVITDIRQSIEKGMTLKKAFEKHKGIFSDFFIGMIEAGESGGKLSDTLEMSACYLEKQVDLRQKVKSAFAYPVVVGVVCLLIVTALLIFVIPTFSKIYKQLHVKLPFATQLLVDISNLITNYWWAFPIPVVVLVFCWKRFRKNEKFKSKIDTFKLRVPLLGKLNRLIVVARFMRTFAMLCSAGVPLVRSLEIAKQVADNSNFTRITEALQQSIEGGNKLASSFEKFDIFPPIIIQLTAAGEESGMLSEMINKGVDFVDKEIERVINSLLVKLEPAMTLFMGCVVGLMLFAVYLPMFDYISHLK